MYTKTNIHKNKPTKKSKHHKTNSKTKKGKLFSDDNPETTVQGYGFQNSQISQHTIDDLKYRDIDYQFQVVNTMYYRGQEVIKRTKDKSKIKNIKNALDTFSKWLSNYKNKNLNKTQSFPYMTYKQIKSLEFLADFYDISVKARGLQKPTTSDKGFVSVWKEVNSDKKRLRNYPIKMSVPQGQTWDKHRNFYITRRLSMIKNSKHALYYTTGAFQGLPTKLHVNMMMWGYSPDAKSVLSNINKYRSIINNYNK